MSFRGNCTPVGIVFCLSLAGCGGGSSSTNADVDAPSEDSVQTGVFVDSPVEGLTFTTETQSGTTNAAGEFSYLIGEQVTFSIGAAEFPAVAAKAQITPIDIAAGSATQDAMTTNIARLLQTLDLDGNPDNGITISADAAMIAPRLNFDVSTSDFENDADVINLVANSGAVGTSLISEVDANSHLNSTLGIDDSEDASFDINDLIASSPWYSIRIYDDRQECGNSYSFSADGSLSAESNGETIAGSFTLSETGVLSLDTVQFGVESRQLNALSQLEWSSNSTNNAGDEYLERAFSNRSTALELATSLGTDCDSELPQPSNATTELAAVGYIPVLGQGNVNGVVCDTANHVGTPGTPGGLRDNIMRDALETGDYALGIQRINALEGSSEEISVYLAYLEEIDIEAAAIRADVTQDTVASRLACAGLIL